MTEKVLLYMKWMLDFCPHAGLEYLKLFALAPQLIVRQRFARRTRHGHEPGHRFPLILFALFNAMVANIDQRSNLVAVQQRALG